MHPYIEMIKRAGFRVFIRPEPIGRPLTYCFYTDGTRIAYAQWGTFRESVSTVHVPNRQTGTGFEFADVINEETLRGALNCHAPTWAAERDRKTVVKYRDMAHYLGASTWNSKLEEV